MPYSGGLRSSAFSTQCARALVPHRPPRDVGRSRFGADDFPQSGEVIELYVDSRLSQNRQLVDHGSHDRSDLLVTETASR
jgi:hypothetical protein